MEIIVNGQPAAIKKGSSFQFVTENRYFTGSDSYTMGITFPLKDCPQNLAIFGHVNRKDVPKKKILFDCEIREGSFLKRGSITITSITDVAVETQFLEGRSKENYASTFDDIYINEVWIAYPQVNPMHASDLSNPRHSTSDYFYSTSAQSTTMPRGFVALPWVNNLTGNLQNKPNRSYLGTEGQIPFDNSVTALSIQPYLWYLLEKLFTVLGYQYDISALKNHPKLYYMLVCNALPSAWEYPNLAAALPHWTMTEFLEQIEFLLNGEFEVDHSLKTVRFGFCSDIIEAAGQTSIDTIIDEYKVDVAEKSDIKYRDSLTLKYAECSHRLWPYYSCDWFIEKMKKNMHCHEMYYHGGEREFGMWISEPSSQSIQSSIVHIRDFDEYLMVDSWTSVAVGGIYKMLNIARPSVREGAEQELKIVPAWLDEAWLGNTYLGDTIFLELPEYNEQSYYSDQPMGARKMFDQGEEATGSQEYLDKLYVAFWAPEVAVNQQYYCPAISCLPQAYHTFHQTRPAVQFTMRLRDEETGWYKPSYKVNAGSKYTFKWIADSIPDIRSLFIIHGRRYVCEKITAKFSEKGMSQLLEGTFFALDDDA